MNRRNWLVAAALVALVGCAVTPPEEPALYLLEGAGVPRHVESDQAPGLAIGTIDLADFLDQAGIVYQSGDHRVTAARNNRWATPLVAQLRPRFAAALAAKLAPLPVHERRSSAAGDEWRLDISVDAFHGRATGGALVAGSWRIVGKDADELVKGAFRESVPLEADGYTPLVRALDTGLTRAAASIVVAIDDCGRCREALP